MKNFKRVILPLWLCLCLNFAFAQINHKLSGTVSNAAGQPLPGATVKLLRDSALLKTGIADAKGGFLFDGILSGNYRLQLSMIGYITLTQPLTLKGDTSVALYLQATNTTLKETVITAQRSYIENKLDRTVINVSGSSASTGSNALEILQRSPGVQVDENGTITFKGKTGVLVLIDDKPTYLSAADLAAYLKSLPASSLSQIELMDTPPARYDAAGNAGAINILTKKLKNRGFNGTVSSSLRQSTVPRAFESLNLNYRTDQFNFFANTSYNYQESTRRLNLDRDYFNTAGQPSGLFNETAWFHPVDQNAAIMTGLDYYPSSKTTWGIVLGASRNSENDHRPVLSSLYNGGGGLDSIIRADNYSRSRSDKTSININYLHHFTAAGQQLSFDLDNVNFGNGANQSFNNHIYDQAGVPEGSQLITNDLPVRIHIYSAKVDYAQVLPGKVKLETGIKSSYVTTDNTAAYNNVIGGISIPDDTNSNRFVYKENINAAYINFNKEMTRFSVQAGLRVENTNNHGDQLGNAVVPDSSFRNSYVNLFPTAYASYKLDTSGRNSLVFSYGRRIGRPYYQDLNPFIFIVDKFTYFTGNPFLLPQYNSNFKLSYRYTTVFTLSATYDHAKNIQNETITQQGDIFYSRPGNIGDRYYYGLNANLHLDPAPWISLNLYSELNHNRYEGALYNTYLQETATWFSGNIYSQFTMGNGWTADCFMYYTSAYANAQFRRIATGQINFGIKKKVLNNRGAVTLYVNDLLNTYSPSGTITDIPNATSSYQNTIDSRAVSLSFTLSFGGADNQNHKNQKSVESETQRVKN